MDGNNRGSQFDMKEMAKEETFKDASPTGEHELLTYVSSRDDNDIEREMDSYPKEALKEVIHSDIPSGKDGGYGWVVLAAVFTMNVIIAGYLRSFGILYTTIKARFPDTSTATAGLIMGLLSGCRGILSPLVGAFAVMAGPRVCSVIGGCIAATGLLLAIPGISAIYLAFTVGAIVGIGICMCETPGVIIISEYFLEKRSTANGLRTSGNAFGGIVFPFISMSIVENFSFQGNFIILAGIVLQMCVLGMLQRPFEVHSQIVDQDYRKSLSKRNVEPLSENMLPNLSDSQEKKNPKKKPLNLRLLLNPAYVIYITMMIFCNIAIANVVMYLPLWGRYKGLSDWENSAILSFLSVFDFFGRMFIGWLSDKNFYAKRHAFVFGLASAGVSLLLLPLAHNLWTVLSIIWIRALGISTFWSLIVSLLADQFGTENMSTSWGFLRMTQGVTNFIYPPLLGFVADSTGSMNAPFVLMGVVQIIGAFIFALQPLVIRLSGVNVPLT